MATVGELFISLGVTGADKTVNELKGVGKGMQGIASDSLAAKAAILGAMYATQQLFSKSGQAGTNLTNFNALIGMSTQTLQQYQFAARQAGVSNEETANTFKNLQTVATDVFSGKGVPAGFQRLQAVTGLISQEDISRAMEDPSKLFERLNQYAQKEKNKGLLRQTLSSFGLSDQMQSAMIRNSFKPETLQRAPTYSENEINALDRANIAWSNLNNKIEMAVGRFNAMHGGQLVKDISMVADQVIKLAEAFVMLSEKVHFFEGLTKVFEGWAAIFNGLSGVVDTIAAIAGGGKEGEKATEKAGGVLTDIGGGFMEMVKSVHFGGAEPTTVKTPTGSVTTGAAPAIKPGGVFEGLLGSVRETAEKQGLYGTLPASATEPVKGTEAKPVVVQSSVAKKSGTAEMKPAAPKKANLKLVQPTTSPRAIAPGVAPVTNKAGNESNVTVNQTLNFNHKVDEPRVAADNMQRQVNHALRQNSAVQQVN